jgi:UDP-glucose 4-epimerase
VRNPLLVELLRSEGVNTVCHLVFVDSRRPLESAFDVNVMGSMKLLGACAEAGVRKVILKSSTMVYGAHPVNPAFLTEGHPIQGSRSFGYTRDLLEIEAFCNGFQRQVPGLVLTILRFANIVGPQADTPMTRFLQEPLAPMLLGFDPPMQVIHEQDVIEALQFAVVNDLPGVINVAAEGVFPLRKLMALAGKIPLPVIHPCVYWGAELLGKSGLRSARFAPFDPDYLRYPWVADLSRMRQNLKIDFQYTGEEALHEFARRQRSRFYTPESGTSRYDEERLRHTILRRQRKRQQYDQEAQGQEPEPDDTD